MDQQRSSGSASPGWSPEVRRPARAAAGGERPEAGTDRRWRCHRDSRRGLPPWAGTVANAGVTRAAARRRRSPRPGVGSGDGRRDQPRRHRRPAPDRPCSGGGAGGQSADPPTAPTRNPSARGMRVTVDRPRKHWYIRPLWICSECAARWPCQPAKLSLLREHQQARIGLTLLMVSIMFEAVPDIIRLESGTHRVPENLWVRFVLWTRHAGGPGVGSARYERLLGWISGRLRIPRASGQCREVGPR